MYHIDLNIINYASIIILKGLKITVFISVISSFIAFIIGVATAYFRTSASVPCRIISYCYVEIVRNTPLLIQLYIYYKGLPEIGLKLSPILCGILALSIYTGAFISEVLRSGLNSIASQQNEAARGLGLTEFQTFIIVIFPQAIRIVIPPLGSQFINLVKNSSLVSFIAVGDIFYYIYKGAVDDFRFFEFFGIGAIIYMVLTGIIAILTNIFEHSYRIPGRAIKV